MTATYLVCATPRSGSTLLCEALKATGVAGRPEEYFEALAATGRPPIPADYLHGLEDEEAIALVGAGSPDAPTYSCLDGVGSYAEHLARAREWGTTPNGVFGAKLMWDHLGQLRTLSQRPLPPIELLDELFDGPRYVWVRRYDTVRQAVSLWRAMQTQSWRADAEDAASRPDGRQPQYCFPALRHLVGRLKEHDARWREVFATTGAPVVELRYRDLRTDLPATIRRTLGHIGVEVADDWSFSPPAMRRQADELSEAWVGAYEREAAKSLSTAI